MLQLSSLHVCHKCIPISNVHVFCQKCSLLKKSVDALEKSVTTLLQQQVNILSLNLNSHVALKSHSSSHSTSGLGQY